MKNILKFFVLYQNAYYFMENKMRIVFIFEFLSKNLFLRTIFKKLECFSIVFENMWKQVLFVL